MKIVLNGETREIEGGQSLLDLLRIAGYQGRRVAVEVNRRIVPRSTHAEVRLSEGDRIEIVHAIGGG
jgi:sulfur carrier protein